MITLKLSKSVLNPLKYTLSILMGLIFMSAACQNNSRAVYVDPKGVMRWDDTQKEVKGFGVNYTVPFAHGYRSAIRMGLDPKTEMDKDIYHLSRLGFDLFRIHVWDTEISDTKGNLLQNEHLDAFDYLIYKLKEKGFNFVITPIAFWGNGWPEPDTPSPGFAYKYGKADCLTNPDAIKAQENYLAQFLNHINPYTQTAYKNDPNVIAFEISNEPHHSGSGTEVTKFVSGMVKALKSTGTKKPIFYNISHGVHFVDDYFKGGIQGGTFQWYPTGLGYQKELSGNLLPNVNDYTIPFEAAIKKHHGAKLVYEFDTADVGKSYLYPAMARSFRTAGIQIATQFAYDPMFTAYSNTEYNTHYMNLVYTPQKALSLMICSKIFHEIPMYENFGGYPKNSSFQNIAIDYERDLAVYNSEDTFIYTNSTNAIPKNETELKQISGYGNSSLVQYDGTGAYFLDQIEEGIWRLELLPDAVWVDNPFGKNSPKKTVAVINWQTHNFTLNLKDLKSDFSVKAINSGNTFTSHTKNQTFKIRPGTYILTRKGLNKTVSPTTPFKQNLLNDFYAPEATVNKTWLTHTPIKEATANTSFKIKATCIVTEQPKTLKIVGYSGHAQINLEMSKTAPYQYEVKIPKEQLQTGYFKYHIIIDYEDGKTLSYPSGHEGQLSDWDYYHQNMYSTTLVPATNPILLFNALEDFDNLVIPWRDGLQLQPTTIPDEAEVQIPLKTIYQPDNENLNAEPIYDYSFKHFILDRIAGRESDLASKTQIIIKGHSLNNKPCTIQLALVTHTGASFGKTITLQPETDTYTINTSDLKPVKTVTLPRPYPSFLPYYFEHQNTESFDINTVESIQFSIGPGISKTELTKPQGIGLINVTLE
ncbi:cellulase family glycosylhydrolase [Formosa sp. S-31]|uniref:cellulase family glycosylhydrolase n=1 Tax=Formosa sp. S-31 TaxID=2790949 RepID=UPI003EBFAB87